MRLVRLATFDEIRLYFLLILISFFLVPPSPARAVKFDFSSPTAFMTDCGEKIVRLSRRKRDVALRWMLGEKGEMQYQVRKLQNAPARTIVGNAAVQKFLGEHRVYLSVTTSPTRIRHLHYLMETLDFTFVEKLIVALPMTFGRDGSAYEIPAEVTAHPKVQIIRVPSDLGPATKVIPAVEYLAQHDPKAVLITVDCDTGYPQGMVSELIFAAAHAPDSVITGSGDKFQSYGIHVTMPSLGNLQSVTIEGLRLKPTELVQGYGAVLYPIEMMDTGTLRRWGSLSPECWVSDDMVLSLALENSGVPRYEVASHFYGRRRLQQFHFGFSADALFRGAGMALPPEMKQLRSVHPMRYQACFKTIAPHLSSQWFATK